MEKNFLVRYFREALFVIAGSFVLAIAINSVLLPNKLVAGGANGISIVLNYLFDLNPALVLYAINIPLLVLCFLFLGKEVALKTVFGSMIYPFFVGITAGIPVLTTNIFLATLYGGILAGIGLGLVFKGNASTGGTAILSQLVHKYLRISLGISILFVDGLVILSAFFAFDVDIVLFSLICLFIIGRVVDVLQVGLVRSKNILIISPEYLQIQQKLITELDKGVTLIPAEGGYKNLSGNIIMTVVREKDFSGIKEVVLAIDPQAFIVSMNASEVHGKGFSLKKVAEDYGLESNNLH